MNKNMIITFIAGAGAGIIVKILVEKGLMKRDNAGEAKKVLKDEIEKTIKENDI